MPKVELEDSELVQLKEQDEKAKKLEAELEYTKSEAKKAYEKRDLLKKEVDEREQKALEEQNKFKELYESVNPKLKEFEEKLAKTEKEKEEVLTKYKAVEDSTRKELLERLPEGEHRDLANDFDIDKLRKYVELNEKKTIKTDKLTDVKDVKTKTSYSNNPWKVELAKIERK